MLIFRRRINGPYDLGKLALQGVWLASESMRPSRQEGRQRVSKGSPHGPATGINLEQVLRSVACLSRDKRPSGRQLLQKASGHLTHGGRNENAIEGA